MLACKKATNFIIEQPEEAFKELVHELPLLNTVLYRKMFERSFAYFSATLQNVQRDWLKVISNVYGADELFHHLFNFKFPYHNRN